MRPYSPGGILPAFAPARKGSIPPTPSIHRLRRGLPGYLIRFAPHALAPQRQLWPRTPFSPPVFRRISTHFTTTPGIPRPSTTLQLDRPDRLLRLSPSLSQPTDQAAYAPFTPSKSGQRSSPTSYRGCWHVVSRDLFERYRHLRPAQKRFTPRRASSRTRRCSVRLAPIAENPSLLPPVGVGAVSQSPCGGPSSQTRYRSAPWCAVTTPPS